VPDVKYVEVDSWGSRDSGARCAIDRLIETLEIGCDMGEPVSEDYGRRGNEFTGKIIKESTIE
jgi:hypothetical protein